MTFDPTPPTEPGYFLWRLHEKDDPTPIEVVRGTNGQLFIAGWFDGDVKIRGGLWCRLVPVDKLEEVQAISDARHATLMQNRAVEVEKAFRELWTDNDYGDDIEEAWANSRAKRVANGENA